MIRKVFHFLYTHLQSIVISSSLKGLLVYILVKLWKTIVLQVVELITFFGFRRLQFCGLSEASCIGIFCITYFLCALLFVLYVVL